MRAIRLKERLIFQKGNAANSVTVIFKLPCCERVQIVQKTRHVDNFFQFSFSEQKTEFSRF